MVNSCPGAEVTCISPRSTPSQTSATVCDTFSPSGVANEPVGGPFGPSAAPGPLVTRTATPFWSSTRRVADWASMAEATLEARASSCSAMGR